MRASVALLGGREGDQRDSFFGDDNMGAIPPKEDEVVLLAVDLLIGIVGERGPIDCASGACICCGYCGGDF